MPDISCSIRGKRRFFELTRVANRADANEMGALLAKTARTGVGQVGAAHAFDYRADLRQSLERKRGKQYTLKSGLPDLLAYFDGIFQPGRMPPRWAKAVVRAEMRAHRGRWSRIWVFDYPQGKLVART